MGTTSLDSAVCCVCSRQYLPQALTMVWSLRQHSNRFSYHLFLSDITKNNGNGLIDKYPEIDFNFIDQFANGKILDNALMLTDLEFNTSLKAVALSNILKRYGRKTFYCDSDLYFLAEPLVAINRLDENRIILTPHQIAPVSDESDFQMSRTGVFNSGFIAMANDEGIAAADWLSHKTSDYCLLEPEEGLFVDQKWLDLVPALFDGVCILRDPGYNIAYWNIESLRSIESLVFLHLSGFDLNMKLEQGNLLSKFSALTIDSPMVERLRPYLDTYNRILEEVRLSTMGTSISFIESNYKIKIPPLARRYSVKSNSFKIVDGEVKKYSRANDQDFTYIRLYRSNHRLLRYTRILGEFFCWLGMARLLDGFISMFRILGRRNSWMR